MPLAARRHRFTVDQYEQMGRAGIFPEGDRVELIRGEIIRMTPIGVKHAGAVIFLNSVFGSRLAGRALISPGNPVVLVPDSEPQPDIVLLRLRPDHYRNSHPVPEDILLVVEVADSSAGFDRRVKIPLYGVRGIRESWLVDLPAEVVEVCRQPGPKGYLKVARGGRGDRISPLAFPDLEIAITGLLGPTRPAGTTPR